MSEQASGLSEQLKESFKGEDKNPLFTGGSSPINIDYKSDSGIKKNRQLFGDIYQVPKSENNVVGLSSDLLSSKNLPVLIIGGVVVLVGAYLMTRKR